MLDGAEDKDQTLKEYNMFLPYIRRAGLLVCHDWYCGKCELIRDIVSENFDKVLLSEKANGFWIGKKL
jgi:hypothetical protein